MPANGGDIIADILKNHGIPFIFTLCGGHISPILVAARKQGIRVIDVRDEVTAVFAADAFARINGKPGVAVVTAGPGVTNSITAMKNAQMAQSPLVLIGGASATILKGRGSLQDIDQISLLQSVVKQAASIKQNCDIVPVFEHALKIARSDTPGPVFIECPIDLLYNEELVRSWYGSSQADPGLKSRIFNFYLEHHVNRMFACDFESMEPAPEKVSIPKLPPDKVEKTVRELQKARKPVLVAGSQAMLCHGESDRLRCSIEQIGVPVYLTGMARGLMGTDHPLQLRHRRREALRSADLVLLAGMPCDFRLDYGRAFDSDATLIAANRNRGDLNLNRKPDIGVQADPAEFLHSLAQSAQHKPAAWQDWMDNRRLADEDRNREILEKSKEQGKYINPLRFFTLLNDMLAENSIIVADGGDFVATASYILQPKSAFSWLDPGVFGTLGVGAGFAMGAKLSRPADEVWLIYGDGAAGYSLQEMDSFTRHGIPVIAVIGNDGLWAQIAREQIDVLHDDVATRLNRCDYHVVAQGYGAEGFMLEREADILPTLQKAKAAARSGKPVVINLLIDNTDFRKGSISM